jgi:hypothetical protein
MNIKLTRSSGKIEIIRGIKLVKPIFTSQGFVGIHVGYFGCIQSRNIFFVKNFEVTDEEVFVEEIEEITLFTEQEAIELMTNEGVTMTSVLHPEDRIKIKDEIFHYFNGSHHFTLTHLPYANESLYQIIK